MIGSWKVATMFERVRLNLKHDLMQALACLLVIAAFAPTARADNAVMGGVDMAPFELLGRDPKVTRAGYDNMVSRLRNSNLSPGMVHSLERSLIDYTHTQQTITRLNGELAQARTTFETARAYENGVAARAGERMGELQRQISGIQNTLNVQVERVARASLDVRNRALPADLMRQLNPNQRRLVELAREGNLRQYVAEQAGMSRTEFRRREVERTIELKSQDGRTTLTLKRGDVIALSHGESSSIPRATVVGEIEIRGQRQLVVEYDQVELRRDEQGRVRGNGEIRNGEYAGARATRVQVSVPVDRVTSVNMEPTQRSNGGRFVLRAAPASQGYWPSFMRNALDGSGVLQ